MKLLFDKYDFVKLSLTFIDFCMRKNDGVKIMKSPSIPKKVYSNPNKVYKDDSITGSTINPTSIDDSNIQIIIDNNLNM